MDFQQWGENRFISYLRERFLAPSTLVGIGDDCAVIPGEGNEVFLVTTDALVEGVHFIKEQISPQDLGYKTVAVSVRDVAAMGGEPKYAFLSVALSKQTDCDWMRQVIEGVHQACLQWNISLLGGDTVGSKRHLFLNLTLIGSANKNHIIYRSGALEGDILCVTASLGDSGAGLKALQQHRHSCFVDPLLQAHFRPDPHPERGAWLAAQVGVHAMMDLSDGLDCDLRRLLQSSSKGACIELSKVPLSPALIAASPVS